MLKTYELMTRHFGWTSRRRALRPGKPPPICSTAPYARKASSAWIRSVISMRRASLRSGARSRQNAPQGVGTGRAGRRGQAGALGAARDAGELRRRAFGAGAHPLAVRSAHHQRKRTHLSSATGIALRLTCRRRNGFGYFCAAGAGRRRHRRRARSQDRSQKPETAAAEMELGRQRRARRAQGAKTPHRGSAAPLRAVSAGGRGA